MFKTIKKLYKGTYTAGSIKDAFIVNYYRYIKQCDDDLLLEYIETQEERVFQFVLEEAENYFDAIGDKESRIEQMIQMRRAILHYLEQAIQSSVYFSLDWSDVERAKIGKVFLPKREPDEINDQQIHNFRQSKILYNTFLMVSAELYKDQNEWMANYLEIFRSHLNIWVDAILEDSIEVRKSKIKMKEASSSMVVDWRLKNIFEGHSESI